MVDPELIEICQIDKDMGVQLPVFYIYREDKKFIRQIILLKIRQRKSCMLYHRGRSFATIKGNEILYNGQNRKLAVKFVG